MSTMCHPRAAERTRNGFSRVQKGRCYLKTPLGSYRTANFENPYHSYSRNDSRDRLAFQPQAYGDIDTLKRQGFTVPSIDEVIFNSFLVTQPWAICEERPQESRAPRTNYRSSIPAKNTKTYCYVPSHESTLDPVGVFEKKKKQEFRQAIIRMGFPTVFGEYINKVQKIPTSVIQNRRTPVPSLDDRGSVMEQELISRAKKSVTGIKQFTATKIPWKNILGPKSLSKVATATNSFINNDEHGKGEDDDNEKCDGDVDNECDRENSIESDTDTGLEVRGIRFQGSITSSRIGNEYKSMSRTFRGSRISINVLANIMNKDGSDSDESVTDSDDVGRML